jgi:bacterioferritin-associated ferredoxin
MLAPDVAHRETRQSAKSSPPRRSCNVLSDHEVRFAVTTGKPLRTIGGLFRYLGCSVQCGRCAQSIKRITEEPQRSINALRGGGCPQGDISSGVSPTANIV